MCRRSRWLLSALSLRRTHSTHTREPIRAPFCAVEFRPREPSSAAGRALVAPTLAQAVGRAVVSGKGNSTGAGHSCHRRFGGQQSDRITRHEKSHIGSNQRFLNVLYSFTVQSSRPTASTSLQFQRLSDQSLARLVRSYRSPNRRERRGALAGGTGHRSR